MEFTSGPEDELANMYQQQQDQHPVMPQPYFAEQQQYYTSPPAIKPNTFPSSFRSLAVPSPSFEASPVKHEPGQQLSSSNIFFFGGRPPMTLNFSGGEGNGVQLQAPEIRSRAPLNTREKTQQQFVALATIVPDLTKTDKFSILGSTIEYVKQLEDKVKTLKEQNMRKTYEPTVFKSKRCITGNNVSGSCGRPFSEGGFSPTVEVSLREDIILLKICCKGRRGVLVVVISELENQGLSIINTSVLSFADSCLDITITAKASFYHE
ncbi:hypothetical protein C2845_PM01G44090 [Panicum miliaceum]|uniref:BHLH domain-containing protein n=1 Tax=Panicum miliaceum TaxID=4540 RepID=A0A3L6TLU5_PANMI|nr:hypothetical protein C2845_PM01G44090 [Panicum miliaceum]